MRFGEMAVLKWKNVDFKSAGENLRWFQKMMGHSSVKVITDRYFSYIPNMAHKDSSKFLEEYGKRFEKRAPNEPHIETGN